MDSTYYRPYRPSWQTFKLTVFCYWDGWQREKSTPILKFLFCRPALHIWFCRHKPSLRKTKRVQLGKRTLDSMKDWEANIIWHLPQRLVLFGQHLMEFGLIHLLLINLRLRLSSFWVGKVKVLAGQVLKFCLALRRITGKEVCVFKVKLNTTDPICPLFIFSYWSLDDIQ